MTSIDEKILETLNNDDRETLESYGRELGIFGLIAESFRGKTRILTLGFFLLVLVFAVVLVYCAIQFFTVDDVGMKLNWMAAALTALFVIGLLRIAYFMLLNRISVVREIKRLGLLIALLHKKS
jgi:hypothetical protein